jgi:DnaJ-class molecular chaperone
MARPPASTEERTIRALREAGAITGPERDAAIAALTATEVCSKCGGDGNAMPEGMPPMCDRCDGTGEQYVIR